MRDLPMFTRDPEGNVKASMPDKTARLCRAVEVMAEAIDDYCYEASGNDLEELKKKNCREALTSVAEILEGGK